MSRGNTLGLNRKGGYTSIQDCTRAVSIQNSSMCPYKIGCGMYETVC